jgi:hypothetical protein
MLFLNWTLHQEGVLGEWEYSSTHRLTSALDGGEWLASRPGRFTPRERASGTHWIGVWVAPRAVLDAAVKRKIPSPSRKSNPRTSIVQPVAQRYTDWAITALTMPVLPGPMTVRPVMRRLMMSNHCHAHCNDTFRPVMRRLMMSNHCHAHCNDTARPVRRRLMMSNHCHAQCNDTVRPVMHRLMMSNHCHAQCSDTDRHLVFTG